MQHPSHMSNYTKLQTNTHGLTFTCTHNVFTCTVHTCTQRHNLGLCITLYTLFAWLVAQLPTNYIFLLLSYIVLDVICSCLVLIFFGCYFPLVHNLWISRLPSPAYSSQNNKLIILVTKLDEFNRVICSSVVVQEVNLMNMRFKYKDNIISFDEFVSFLYQKENILQSYNKINHNTKILGGEYYIN